MHHFSKLYKYSLLLFALQFITQFPSLGAQQLKLPDCSTVKIIHFNVPEILNFESRALYQESIDTIESLYCYAKSIQNLELEAISLYKFSTLYHEVLNNPEDFIASISYLNECIDISQRNNFLTPLFWAKEKTSTVLTTNKMYKQASIYADELTMIAKRMNKPRRIAEAYMVQGRLLREQGQYAASDSLLHLSLKHIEKRPPPDEVLGYTYLHLSKLKRLEKKYLESIEYAQKGLICTQGVDIQKREIQAYLIMELTLSYVKIGDYEKATEALTLISDYSDKYHKWIQVQNYIINGTILESSGQIDEAITKLAIAKNLSIKANTYTLTLQISQKLIELYKTKKKVDSDTYDLFNEIITTFDEISERNSQGNLFKSTYYKLKSEQKNSALLQLKLKNFHDLLAFIFGFFILLIIIAILIYRQIKIRKTYYLKTSELNAELKKNNDDLTKSHREIEKKKDELLLELKHQLLILSSQNNMVQKLKQTIETADGVHVNLRKQILNILEFERNKNIIKNINLKFLELNGDLLRYLSTSFPQLTSNDLKLCLYLSMNLSTKEIAQIQFKSTDSIKVARFRLRKKLGISNSSIKLSAFLYSYRR